jgi:hypothetical protein
MKFKVEQSHSNITWKGAGSMAEAGKNSIYNVKLGIQVFFSLK